MYPQIPSLVLQICHINQLKENPFLKTMKGEDNFFSRLSINYLYQNIMQEKCSDTLLEGA